VLFEHWKCSLFSFFYPVMNIMIFTKIRQYILGLNRLMLCTCAVIISMVYVMMCLNKGNYFNNVSLLFQVFEYYDAVVLVQLWS
jgi:hypothetical protein